MAWHGEGKQRPPISGTGMSSSRSEIAVTRRWRQRHLSKLKCEMSFVDQSHCTAAAEPLCMENT